MSSRRRRDSAPAAGLVLAALALAAPALHAETPNEDWLRRDREVLRLWGDKLAPGDLTAEAFLRRLEGEVGSGRGRPRDLGFGLETISLTRPGGYLSLQVTLVVHEGRIAQMRATCTGPGDVWSRIGEQVAAAWPTPARTVDLGRYHRREHVWTDEGRVDLFRRALAAELGEPQAPTVPPDLAWAVEVLTSPFSQIHVNLTGGCYFAGVAPEGKKAVDSLVKAGRWDLVRLAARGSSPEGRVYAARALLGLPAGRMTPDDRGVVERIRALPISVEVCSGCIVSGKRAADILVPTP